MVKLKVRKVVYEDQEFEVDEILTIKGAAERLGVTIDAVIATVRRGQLTELIDEEAINPFKNRRFVLREEVEALAERRARAAALEGVE